MSIAADSLALAAKGTAEMNAGRGIAATLTRPAGGTYDTATGTVSAGAPTTLPLTVLVSGWRQRRLVSGGWERFRRVTIPADQLAGVVPTSTDVITFEGQPWRIFEVERPQPPAVIHVLVRES